MRKLIYIAGMIIIFAAAFVVVQRARPNPLAATPSDESNAKPVITWSVPKVLATLFPGTSTTVTVHFTSNQNLANVAVVVNQHDEGDSNGGDAKHGQSARDQGGSTKGVFSVSPVAFASIAANRDYQITVIFTAPLEFNRTVVGSLQLRSAEGSDGEQKTYAPSLPLALTTGVPPKISWSVSQLTQTMFPGTSSTVILSFQSDQNFSGVAVDITPSLEGIVSASPVSFASITANQPYQVMLTLAAPSAFRQAELRRDDSHQEYRHAAKNLRHAAHSRSPD